MPTIARPRAAMGRRTFLKEGALVIAAASVSSREAVAATEGEPALRVGLLTDLHYADKPPAGSRHYRETLGKLAEAAEFFAKDPPDLLVELGDLIDSADSVEEELANLAVVQGELSVIGDDRHCVLGNHCVHTLTKEEFLGGVEQEGSYYSFDRAGVHFIVLDACFRGDGEPYGRANFEWTDPNVAEAELEWLESDLNEATGPTVVFAHQRLDVSNVHGVKNGAAVRRVLETSGQVAAVFQGHSHANDLNVIAGVPYCTLVAMVEGSGLENSGYSLLEIYSDGSLRLNGFRRQDSHDLSQAK